MLLIKELVVDKTKRLNEILNTIYNEVTKEAFSLDTYRMPYHGIKHPERENPVNLF